MWAHGLLQRLSSLVGTCHVFGTCRLLWAVMDFTFINQPQYDIDNKEKVKHDTHRDIKEQAGGRIEFIPLVSSSHGRCSDKMKKLYSRLADSRLGAQGVDPKKGHGRRLKSIIMQQYWQEYAVAHFKGILLLLKGMSRLAQKQLRRGTADIRSTPISSATTIQPHQASSPTTVAGMSPRST